MIITLSRLRSMHYFEVVLHIPQYKLTSFISFYKFGHDCHEVILGMLVHIHKHKIDLKEQIIHF